MGYDFLCLVNEIQEASWWNIRQVIICYDRVFTVLLRTSIATSHNDSISRVDLRC
jgi:hypothetical protein